MSTARPLHPRLGRDDSACRRGAARARARRARRACRRAERRTDRRRRASRSVPRDGGAARETRRARRHERTRTRARSRPRARPRRPATPSVVSAVHAKPHVFAPSTRMPTPRECPSSLARGGRRARAVAPSFRRSAPRRSGRLARGADSTVARKQPRDGPARQGASSQARARLSLRREIESRLRRALGSRGALASSCFERALASSTTSFGARSAKPGDELLVDGASGPCRSSSARARCAPLRGRSTRPLRADEHLDRTVRARHDAHRVARAARPPVASKTGAPCASRAAVISARVLAQEASLAPRTTSGIVLTPTGSRARAHGAHRDDHVLEQSRRRGRFGVIALPSSRDG